MIATLKLPKNRVASIILKWNNQDFFQTEKDVGKMSLVEDVTKNPMVPLEIFCACRRKFQKVNCLCKTLPVWVLW